MKFDLRKSYNDIEDFLTDESFRSWIISPTPELDEVWENWVELNQDKVDLVIESREIIQSLKFKEFSPDEETKQRIYDRLKQKETPSKYLIPRSWYNVAAAVVMLIAIGAIFYFKPFLQESEKALSLENELIKKVNVAGVKSQHMLSDGSKIFLNSGSSIAYPKVFEDDIREVVLTGEAYFQVSHDSNRPFIVKTDRFEVEVLGTEFNVNVADVLPSVALVDGRVRVSSSLSSASIELYPGKMAIMNEESGFFTSRTFEYEDEVAWKDGRLVFNEATLDEVIEKLHTWYGVEIAIQNKPSSSNWSYTANFDNESLENVMLNMSTLRQFEYEIKNDSLIISF